MTVTKKISDFQSGIYEKQIEYNSFLPEPINVQWIIDSVQIQTLLSEADRKLGELNAFAQLVPDIDFFISMHVTKEATMSSRIEGTQTNMEEALLKEDDLQPEKRNDWAEVQNYISAINGCLDAMKILPVCTRLICKAHAQLLQGVRGKTKLPGEFRRSQNWIGSSLKNAIYIPPSYEHISRLMGDLENFIHNEDINVPPLIRIGIVHYQFETIHPFLDGNGRMGRLLITLYLLGEGLLKSPALYLSEYFERNRILYYDSLHLTRLKNDLEQWLTFFLNGVIETSDNSIETFKAIIKLREKMQERILKIGTRSKIEKANRLLKYLYKKPFTSVNDIIESLGFETTTANRLIKDFLSLGIVNEFTGFKRNRMFVFEEYFKLFLRED